MARPADDKIEIGRVRPIENVVKKFGDSTAVKNVNLSIVKNELFALLGSSGCGKSTLAAHARGARDGHVGRDSGRRRRPRRDAAVPSAGQHDVPVVCAVSAMSVEANIAFGLKQEGMPKNEIKERVPTCCDLVQMSTLRASASRTNSRAASSSAWRWRAAGQAPQAAAARRTDVGARQEDPSDARSSNWSTSSRRST